MKPKIIISTSTFPRFSNDSKPVPPVTIVGTLPPVTGISPFCIGLTRTLKAAKIDFETIKAPYPVRFYPGTLYDNSSLVLLEALPKNVSVHQDLVWWNPIAWLRVGLRINTPTLYINWWTVALSPMLLTIVVINRWRGKKIFALVHNPVGHERLPFDTFLTKIFFRFCHQFFVLNDQAKDYLVKHYTIRPEFITVQKHPPLDFYPNQKVSKKMARRKLGLPQEAKTYLSFGRIRKYKNLSKVINYFAQIAKQDPKALLVIAGEPWIPFGQYQTLIDSLNLADRIYLFLKFIPTDEVSFFFQAADFSITAYQDIGSGSSVEAVAKSFRLPIITIRLGDGGNR